MKRSFDDTDFVEEGSNHDIKRPCIVYLPEAAIWHNHIFRLIVETYEDDEMRTARRSLRLTCKALHQMVLDYPDFWTPFFRFPYESCIRYLENALKFGWDLSKSAMMIEVTSLERASKDENAELKRTLPAGERNRLRSLFKQTKIPNLAFIFQWTREEVQEDDDEPKRGKHRAKTRPPELISPWILSAFVTKQLTFMEIYGKGWQRWPKKIAQCLSEVLAGFDSGFHLSIEQITSLEEFRKINAKQPFRLIPACVTKLSMRTPHDNMLSSFGGEPEWYHTIFRDTMRDTVNSLPGTVKQVELSYFHELRHIHFNYKREALSELLEGWDPSAVSKLDDGRVGVLRTLYDVALYRGDISIEKLKKKEIVVDTPTWPGGKTTFYAKFVKHPTVEGCGMLDAVRSIETYTGCGASYTMKSVYLRGKNGANITEGKENNAACGDESDSEEEEGSEEACNAEVTSWMSFLKKNTYWELPSTVKWRKLRERPVYLKVD